MIMNPSRRSRQSSSTTTEDQSPKLQQDAAPNLGLCTLCIGILGVEVSNWRLFDDRQLLVEEKIGNDYFLVINEYLVEPAIILILGVILSGISGFLLLKSRISGNKAETHIKARDQIQTREF
jgi:hypothetical protein